MPGTLLDSIRDREDQGDYSGDNRYTAFDRKRKFGVKPKSRKEKRQEERKLKKQKRTPVTKSQTNVNPKVSMKNKDGSKSKAKVHPSSISLDEHSDEEDPMEALKRLKDSSEKSSKVSDIRIVKEDDLDDDSFSDFDQQEIADGSEDLEDDDDQVDDDQVDDDPIEALRKLKAKKGNKPTSDIKIVKEDDLDDDSLSDMVDDDVDDEDLEIDEDLVDNPLEALKKLKKNKSSSTDIRIVKEDDLEDDSFSEQELLDDKSDSEPTKERKSKKRPKTEKVSYAVPPLVREQMRKDEEEMEYYAKKLGLKNGKHSKLSKTDEDDAIGGLLDGLDLDFANELDSVQESEDLEEYEASNKVPTENNTAYGSDDSISDGDFDSDLDSELEELYGKQGHPNASDDDFTNESTIPSKENPFVAPVQDDENSGSYIPPALRRKMALEAGEMSEEIVALQRKIKSSLNKLSEGNISTIINDINGLFVDNPRHLVIENLTNIIIDGVVMQGRLLETFVHLQSCVVSAIFRLQGVEFGAHFIQTLVEKFLQDYKDATKTKEVSNIVSLLSTVFTFQLISSRLIYDTIKLLINEFNESNAEILLRLIKNCGNQIRSEDPTGLKEIILMMNKVSSSMKEINPRTQFLIETINSLKNNKMKVNNDFSHELTIRLKKFLGGLGSHQTDPIQVGLDDIRNVGTNGKWWLVGAAWKGNEKENVNNYDLKAMNEILDSAEPNWMQIAKEQRMNTDIRRAIFITIMSAEDYVDALTKLDKLQLKKAQEREIPRILIHCVSIEQSWNPYYGLLANKLAESHSYRKTIQFLFWDVLREFESSDGLDSDNEDSVGFDVENETDDAKVKRIYNLGRFFGFLMAEGSLPLHSLKNVNFLVASNDLKLFMEIILVTFLDLIAKKSQINLMGSGIGGKIKTADLKFSDQLLMERILKSREQPALLRGLQYFVQEKTLKSTFVDGKRQKKRIEWGSNAMFDIIEELLQHAEEQ